MQINELSSSEHAFAMQTVKVGATYEWGRYGELCNFNFAKPEEFERLPRPGSYEGIRRSTAFQVDHARYGDLSLRNAQPLGCQVRQVTAVGEVEHLSGLDAYCFARAKA